MKIGERKIHKKNVTSSSKFVNNDRKNLIDEIGWNQLKPWTKIKNNKEIISINTATIHGIAKKLMAREWTKILGKTHSSKYDVLEKEASFLKNRLEKNKKKKIVSKIRSQKKELR